ncbi:Cilia- and flagella-associated protein 47, partial [Coelomomyces lativittatus]
MTGKTSNTVDLLYLLKLAEILKNDHTLDQTYLYSKCWTHLQSALNHDEPTIRYFALRIIYMCKETFSRSLYSIPLCMELGNNLYQLSLFDSFLQIRHMALSLLSELIPQAFQLSCPLSWLRSLLNTAKKLVNEMLDISSLSLLPSRILRLFESSSKKDTDYLTFCLMSLKFLASFLGCIHLLEPELEKTIYFILSCLIHPSIKEETSLASLEYVFQFNGRSNQSRLHIETFFLPKVHKLYQLYIDSNTPRSTKKESDEGKNLDGVEDQSNDHVEVIDESQIEQQFGDNQSIAETSTDSLSSEMDFNVLRSTSRVFSKASNATFSHFLSAWYIRPSDSFIASLPSSTFQNDHLKGYLYTRYCWLKNNSKRISTDTLTPSLPIPLFKSDLQPKTIPPSSVKKELLHTFCPYPPYDFSFLNDSPQQQTTVLMNELNSLNSIASHLTLSITEGQSLDFTHPPYERTIYVNNSSESMSCKIQVQVLPPFFSIKPNLATVPAHGSLPLHIEFQPRPHPKLKQNEVRGYICIRTSFGLPFIYLNLKGVIPPFLRCPIQELDFGSTSPNENKILYLPIYNHLKTEFVFRVSLSDTTFFQATPLQAVILGGERKLIKLNFHPKFKSKKDDENVVSESLIVTVHDIETIKINLKASIQIPLKLNTNLLDFGQVDITWDTQYKVLLLTNTLNETISVYLHSTTRELHYPEHVVLHRKEQKKIQIGFTPAYNGPRQETLYLHGPFSSYFSVQIQAYSGKPVLAGLCDQVFLPPSFKKAKYIVFPIINTSYLQQRVLIQTKEELNFNLADPRSYNCENIMVELSPYSDELQGYMLTFSGLGTAPIQLSHTSQLLGFHLGEFTLYHYLPAKQKRIFLSKHQVFYMRLSPTLLELDSFVERFHQFLESGISFTEEIEASNPKETTPSSAAVTTTINGMSSGLELEPNELILHGTLKHSSFVCEGTLTLTNNSNQIQNFHVFAPTWIILQVPKIGSLSPISSLDIHFSIRVPPSSFKSDGDKDVFIGYICAMNDSMPKGLLYCTICAVPHFPASIHSRKNIYHLDFGSVKLLSKTTKKLLVQNFLPVNCTFECSLSPISDSTIQDSSSSPTTSISTSSTSTTSPPSIISKLPFSLACARLLLKPFATTTLDVLINSTVPGCFSCECKYEFSSSLEHLPTPILYSGTLYFSCKSGNCELKVTPDHLIFPETSKVRPSSIDLLLENPTLYDGFNLIVHENMPNLVFDEKMLDVPKASNFKRTIKFYASTSGPQIGFFYVHCLLWCSIFSFFSMAGELDLILVGQGSLLSKKKDIFLDLGLLIQGKRKKKFYEIKNVGSLYVSISDLHLEANGGHFVCKVVDEIPLNAPRALDKYFEAYGQETDWDNLNQIENEEKLKTTSKNETKASHPSSATSTHLQLFEDCLSTLTPDFEVPTTPILDNSMSSTAPQGNNTQLNHPSPMFPFILKPFQSFFIYISAVAFESSKPIEGSLKLQLNTLDATSSSYEIQLPVGCRSVRSLISNENFIEFGICDSLHRHEKTFNFTNVSDVILEWSIELKSLTLTPAHTLEPQSIHGHHHYPIQFRPSKGYLLPKKSKSIQVVLYSNFSHLDILAQCELTSPNFCTVPFTVHGILSKALVQLSSLKLDFGTLSVGSQDQQSWTISNHGGIPCHFLLKSGHPYFYCEPEEGVIDSFGKISIEVYFHPQSLGSFVTELKLHYFSTKNHFFPPKSIKLQGGSGFSDFYVHTKEIDFGTAIFGSENTAYIHVENKGSAGALVSLTSYYSSIFLKEKNPVIPPNSICDVAVIYLPQFLEVLNTKVFLKTLDRNSDVFLVKVHGKVGISKLEVIPKELFENFDFGATLVRGVYSKFITLKNTGNIPLNFQIKIQSVDGELTPFHVDLVKGHLKISQEQVVHVFFRPPSMKAFIATLEIIYELHTMSTQLRGIGGQLILTIQPPSILEFGVCRLYKVARKEIVLENKGNYGMMYQSYIADASDQFQVVNPEGFCKSKEKTIIFIDFCPTTQEKIQSSVKIHCGEDAWDLVLSGAGEESKLILRDFNDQPIVDVRKKQTSLPSITTMQANDESGMNNGGVYPYVSMPVLELGIQPVGSVSQMPLKLANEGPFGIDFFIEPFRTPEFQIIPQRGFIVPGACEILLLTFSPTSECIYTGTLCIIWENQPIYAMVKASGGVGNLEIKYTTPSDVDLRALDFGMVPIGTHFEKRLFLVNDGLVSVSFETYVTSPDFLVAPVGQSTQITENEINVALISSSTTLPEPFFTSFKSMIQPKRKQEVAVKFLSKQQKPSKGKIVIYSETAKKEIEMTGKGGTLQLSHKGNLVFENIAARFTSVRKLTIRNTGSISTMLTFGWSLIRGGGGRGGGEGEGTGHHIGSSSTSNGGGFSGPEKNAFIELGEVYGPLNVKNGWTRKQLYIEKDLDRSVPLTAKDYWWMIQRVILPPNYETIQDVTNIGFQKQQHHHPYLHQQHQSIAEGQHDHRNELTFNAGQDNNNMYSIANNVKTSDGKQKSEIMEAKLALDSTGLLDKHVMGSIESNVPNLKTLKKKITYQHQRKQLFYSNIKAYPVSSQVAPSTQPFIRVDPSSCLISGLGEVEIKVEINLPTEEFFLATLVCTPRLPNTKKYEISLTASPKFVSAAINDHRPVDFGCQLIGHREVIRRIITNVGNRDFNFIIEQENRYVSVIPVRGLLTAGQSVMIEFAYEPINETPQMAPAYFIPDCSQPIRIQINGSGGYAKMSLPKNKKFDFGHCMIGKDTLIQVPLKSEGNAILHIKNFELAPGDSFFKGPGWPTSRISIYPNETFHLPVIFNPRIENPNPGRLLLGNTSELYELLLVGYGREAVLIVTKLAVDFHDCLIGNSYSEKLRLKNVGDVNYPITFELSPMEKVIELFPKEMTIAPFSECYVEITFKPIQEIKSQQVNLSIISPYSTNNLPITLHSGFGELSMSTEEIDFGLFEKLSRPRKVFSIENTGSVSMSYVIRQSTKPHLFHITNPKGTIASGKLVPIAITYVQPMLGHFSETLVVKTELQSVHYAIKVIGQCEEAVVKAEEFKTLLLGVCPVLEVTTKTFSLMNYGKFPLTYQIKNAYPLKFNKLKGSIEGGERETLDVSWYPSGGYELRTQVELITNAGVYYISIRGKAMFPELVLKKYIIDFGVGAVGYTYTEPLELFNKGKVNLYWSIPHVRDAFSIHLHQGVLPPKETQTLWVTFKPMITGRHLSSFIIECKGLNFKEISLCGIGGNLSIQYPMMLDVGACPWDHALTKSFMVHNTGHVPILANFEPILTPKPSPSVTLHPSLPQPPHSDDQVQIQAPAPASAPDSDSNSNSNPNPNPEEEGVQDPNVVAQLSLPLSSTLISPDTSHRFYFSIKAKVVGTLTTKFLMRTREKTYPITVRGHGIKIELSESATALLHQSSTYP